MKKMMAMLLAVLMCGALLCACGNEPSPTDPASQPQQTETPTTGETEPAVTDAPETEPVTEAQTEPVTEAQTEAATEEQTEPATEISTEPAETEPDAGTGEYDGSNETNLG